MGLIDSPENGATEIPGTSNDSLFVFLGGPIRYWWTPGVEGSYLHRLYMTQREQIHAWLSEDYLVYAAHRAWRGPWNEVAQKINDMAVLTCDAFVWLHVDGVLAHGTDEELWLAQHHGKPAFRIDIGPNVSAAEQYVEIRDQLDTLDIERQWHK
jgi:hypothetical protein